MISFLFGLLLGGGLGIFIAALCAAVEENELPYWWHKCKSMEQQLHETLSLPNCNDCANVKNCPYRPEWGKTVRINCPLRSDKDGNTNCTLSDQEYQDVMGMVWNQLQCVQTENQDMEKGDKP